MIIILSVPHAVWRVRDVWSVRLCVGGLRSCVIGGAESWRVVVM